MKTSSRLMIACFLLLASACGGASDTTRENSTSEVAATATRSETPEASAPKEAFTPPPTKADDFGWPQPTARVLIKTSMGDITADLYGDAAPQTVGNFLTYVDDGHYDRTIIHRVVPGFVIQGGGYSQYFSERPTREPAPYEGDNNLPNYRTTLAMARTMDPQSAAAQWYINLRDNPRLDHLENDLGVRYGYTVFGRVIEGMAVADRIGLLETGPGGPFDSEVPVTPVLIERVEKIDTPKLGPEEGK